MVRYKKPNTYYIINNRHYILGEICGGDVITNTLFNFKSIDEDIYPSIEYNIEKVQFAHRTAIVTQYKNHDKLLVDDIRKEGCIIKIPFGHPILGELNTTKDDKGYWSFYIIPKSEKIELWEERYPVDGFQYPENMAFREKIIWPHTTSFNE